QGRPTVAFASRTGRRKRRRSLTPHHVRALAVRRSRRVGLPSDFRPPCVPLARVNQVLFGVKRRGGVSGCLSTRESPDRPRERLAEGLRRDARALDESTAT